MDRNSVLGLILIGIILVVYSIVTAPSQQEREKMVRMQDSLLRLQAMAQSDTGSQVQKNDLKNNQVQKNDQENLDEKYGVFAQAMKGKDTLYRFENELLKLKISSKGGRVYEVELKKYKRYDSLPLVIFTGDTNKFSFNFFARNRMISTSQLYFTPVENIVNDSSVVFTIRAMINDNSGIEYRYALQKDSYLVDFKVRLINLHHFISGTSSFITLNWDVVLPRLEKGYNWEQDNSGVYFKHYQDEVESLSSRSDAESKNIPNRMEWIAYKQQFFSSALIAKDPIQNADVKTSKVKNDESMLRICSSEMAFHYLNKTDQTIHLQFYFGPNHYKTMKKTGYDLQKMIPLGWSIFGWVNRIAVIPLFNWLGELIENYGIIILLMTIIIKIVLFPLTYKSYLSTAKMKVLKPRIDEIGSKFPKPEDAMKKQQAIMAFYKKAGVSPLSGCLPMLLQLPILIAMFNFFPSSIELRHESFLWADDLSSYDSILDLPFTIPFYGSHVSLFCLLMTITNFVYIWVSDQASSSPQQMPGMKFMIYFMPVMMLLWFNSYASGLSYYYFLSLLITILQTVIMRRMVDEKELLAKVAAAEKKPVQKSNFQKRLEEMAKQKGYKMPKK